MMTEEWHCVTEWRLAGDKISFLKSQFSRFNHSSTFSN
ncbi:hypothetical protein RR45_GL000211 [Lactococcus chungangensis CAU 28 = DSM 22330]|uniref:Uncharacterized protein n=1 Tax=Pseudolactococcus chungangensis CAU 28 = DSM 22330 TaxID=1122154 RepID=A0ABX4IA58_9LACT|nr:hypothetical protein RR45_GL000211 [Lactococcus chungangensis CAU 28 = DSM 22330]